ncbi:MAG: hypothetical protein U0165_14650 [Polyangiaceae bacterium]
MVLLGAQGNIQKINVKGTTPPPGSFQGGTTAIGSGFIVAACSNVTADKIALSSNASLGLLVDNSSASIGSPSSSGSERGIIIQGNEGYGAWIQNIDDTKGQQATLSNAKISNNTGVGLGLGGTARGIIIQGLEITNTKPTVVAGSDSTEDLGDGICWRDGAEAKLDNISLSGNSRTNIFIDNATGGGSSVAGIIIQGKGSEGSIIIQGTNGPTDMPAGMSELSPTLVPSGTLLTATNPSSPTVN